jgi:hypothetical protein
VILSTEWKIERTQATHKIVTGLFANIIYEVQVRAKNSAGWSDFTELVVVRTPKEKTTSIVNANVGGDEKKKKKLDS